MSSLNKMYKKIMRPLVLHTDAGKKFLKKKFDKKGINVKKEYELIKIKKSKLSSNLRKEICILMEGK